MSNFDRAVKALNDVDEDYDFESGHLADNTAYVTALEAAGLLMPDLPELAQAPAGETYEYQVQARSMKRPAWKPSTNGVLQKWYGAEDIEEAKDKARMYTPYFRGRENVEIRVLRRRVSPVEVINE